MATKRLAFAYGRALVVSRLFVWLVLTGLVVIVVVNTPDFPVLTVAILGAVLAAYVALLVLSPLLTQHWLTRSRLILRQGWYFRCVIPLADAESMGPYDWDPKFGLRI